jgi:nitroreductase
MPRIISSQLLVNDFGNLGSPIQQASIYPAVQNMLLAARALYLGATLTRCICSSRRKAEAALGFPLGVHSYALVPIGYPMGRFGPVRHIALADVVYEDQWGQAYRDFKLLAGSGISALPATEGQQL